MSIFRYSIGSLCTHSYTSNQFHCLPKFNSLLWIKTKYSSNKANIEWTFHGTGFCYNIATTQHKTTIFYFFLSFALFHSLLLKSVSLTLFVVVVFVAFCIFMFPYYFSIAFWYSPQDRQSEKKTSNRWFYLLWYFKNSFLGVYRFSDVVVVVFFRLK